MVKLMHFFSLWDSGVTFLGEVGIQALMGGRGTDVPTSPHFTPSLTLCRDVLPGALASPGCFRIGTKSEREVFPGGDSETPPSNSLLRSLTHSNSFFRQTLETILEARLFL